ncbi:MAG: hypothetical protein NT139_01740 [Candidatus Woesearchaeota archaeon]|nr:hypothetical protein [Candidatus Woesearchaeota archaeon]
MGSVILKNAIKRKPGYLYYVDGKGSVILKNAIKRKPGYLYYVDGKGNVCEAKMARGGKRKKKK